MSFARGVWLMYRFCRDGYGYPNPRRDSLRMAVAWAWRFR